MKKVLLAIAALIVIGVAALLIRATTMPDSFRFERKIEISAPPEVVHAFVEDFHQWEKWNPFERGVPNFERNFDGAAGAVGSMYSYKSEQMGEGKMTLRENVRGQKVVIGLEFIKPFPAQNTATFEFLPTATGSTASWVMEGPQSFPSKVMGSLVNMERMLGTQFERGLMDLKLAAEAKAKESASAAAGAGESSGGVVEITLERTFDAPAEKVWKAWTDAKELQKWWGPKGYSAPVAQVDAKEGGKYLVAMKADAGGPTIYSAGTYTKVEAGKRLEAEDSFSDEKGNIVAATTYGLPEGFPMKAKVTQTFESLSPTKTKLVITQQVPGGQIADMTMAGWNESFDKLAASLQ